MRVGLVAALVGLFLIPTMPVFAQTADRLYAGATLVSPRIEAEDVDTGSVVAAGGTFGVKLTPHWAVQVDVSRSFGELSRVYEGIGSSFAGPGASREEIERLGVYQRFERSFRPQVGWSGLIVWRDPAPRRVGVALLGGVSATRFRKRYAITTLRIPSGVDPNERSIQNSDEVFTRTHGGLTGGVMVPIAVGHGISIAPEVRYTYGSFGDEIYTAFVTGVRTLWRF